MMSLWTILYMPLCGSSVKNRMALIMYSANMLYPGEILLESEDVRGSLVNLMMIKDYSVSTESESRLHISSNSNILEVVRASVW